jgi:hypothetical protein
MQTFTNCTTPVSIRYNYDGCGHPHSKYPQQFINELEADHYLRPPWTKYNITVGPHPCAPEQLIVTDNRWCDLPSSPPPPPPPAPRTRCATCPSSHPWGYGQNTTGSFCCASPLSGRACLGGRICCLTPGSVKVTKFGKHGCQGLPRCGNNPHNKTACPPKISHVSWFTDYYDMIKSHPNSSHWQNVLQRNVRFKDCTAILHGRDNSFNRFSVNQKMATRATTDNTNIGKVAKKTERTLVWGQNLSIVEPGPFVPGQTVTYIIAVWLGSNCTAGSSAEDVVLTLSLLAHSDLVTHQTECSTFNDVNFVECSFNRLSCGNVYTLRVLAQLPVEGYFAPFIASVSSKSIDQGFRTFDGGFHSIGTSALSSDAVQLRSWVRSMAQVPVARTQPPSYFACVEVAGKDISITSTLIVPAGHPCKTCCFEDDCWLDRGQLVVQNYELGVGKVGVDNVVIEGVSEGLQINGTRGPPWPVKSLPKECHLNGSRLLCYKNHIAPGGLQRGFSGRALPQPLKCNVSAAPVSSKYAIVAQFWAARTLAGDVSWQLCRTFVNGVS